MKRKNLWYALFFIFLSIFFLVLTSAHYALPDFVIIESKADVSENNITFHMLINYPLDKHDNEQQLMNYFQENLRVYNDKEECLPIEVESFYGNLDVYFQGSNETTIFNVTYSCNDAIRKLNITSIFLLNYFNNVQHYLTLEENDYLLDKDNTNLFIDIEKAEKEKSFFAVAFRFIKIGIFHILTGYDHVLFIIAFILVVTGMKDLLKITISFTVAHSITLILSALQLMTLTSRVVEPLIALSISYMALENLKKEQRISRKWKVTFFFGLIHGLGFAGILKEIKIPEQHFLTSLLSFNIGVELGQIFILLVAVPIIKYIHKTHYEKRFVRIFSSLIILAGLFLFLSRIFGFGI